MAEFSQRVEQIENSKDELIEAFVADHGRRPTGVEIVRLRQQATIATRPAKTDRSLSEMTDDWRRRAGNLEAGYANEAWVTSLLNRNDLPLLSAGDLAEPILEDAARVVAAAVAEKRTPTDETTSSTRPTVSSTESGSPAPTSASRWRNGSPTSPWAPL